MIFFLFLLGLAIGSFLNVLIDRLPVGENVFMGRSHCDFCKKTLRWYELIPLFSWIIQGGRCRRCHKRLSIQYPLVELITGIGFILIYYPRWIPVFTGMTGGAGTTGNVNIVSFAYLLIFSSLLVIFVADLKYQIIPDSMVVVGIIGALIRLIGFIGQIRPIEFLPYFLSAVGGASFFLFLWILTKGRGMGLGDVKLVFFLGLLLGFPGIIVALYAAFLTGAAVGVILILRGKKTLKGKVAFGPFLIIGTVFALQWMTPIIRFWASLW